MLCRQSALWSVFWIVLALLFGLGIHLRWERKALQYLTGYVIEKSLSVDNLFVFLMIFSYFAVPPKFQPRVLHWGIMGALIMRLVIILVGATLVHKFARIPISSALCLSIPTFQWRLKKKLEPEKIPCGFSQMFRSRPAQSTTKIFERINGRVHATSLFVVLILVEKFGPYICSGFIPLFCSDHGPVHCIYVQCVCHTGSPRALLLLSSIMPMFRFLKYGLSII